MTADTLKLGGHRGLGCTDHQHYQALRDVPNLPVENTVDSIAAAFNQGASYVEIDAVMSKDGVMFVLHNVVPKDHFFGEDMPTQMLNMMNFADFKDVPTGRNSQGRVALLNDVLETIAERDPKTLPWAVNIEIKGVQGSGQNYETNDYLETLADTVRSSSLDPSRVLFSSFSLENVIRMSHRMPQAQFGMLFADKGEVRGICADHRDDFRYQYLQFDADSVETVYRRWNKEAHDDVNLSYVHPEILTITENVMDIVKQKDMGINAWALFEKFDESRAAIYKQTIVAAKDRSVPLTFITDYLHEMRKLQS